MNILTPQTVTDLLIWLLYMTVLLVEQVLNRNYSEKHDSLHSIKANDIKKN